MTKNKHRRFLNLEFILVPIIGLIYLFSYPPLFVFGASGVASMLWIVTGLISPRKQKSNKQAQPEIQVDVPTVACPSCDTSIPVLSDERPLRIACSGCGKTIKIVG